MNRRTGATLLELLVVIAIISVLATVIVPTAARAVRSVKRVSCAFNLRAFSLALSYYANENRGFLPRTAQQADVRDRPDLAANIIWHRPLNHDLAATVGSHVSKNALNCPEARQSTYRRPASDVTTVYSNYLFLWGAVNGAPQEGVDRFEFASPSAVSIADLTWTMYRDGEGHVGGNHVNARGSGYRPQPFIASDGGDQVGTQYLFDSRRYIAGLNAAFFDGSAQWVPRQRGAWRDTGPFAQGEFRSARVFLPARGSGS